MAPRNPQSPTPYSLFPTPYSVAYLVNQYPTVSHTFIRREIEALERRGVEVKRIAIRGWDGALPDPADAAERKATRYVLRDGPLALAAAVLRLGLTRPLRLISAVRLAWHLSRGAERPFAVHLVYLAEAARIVPWLEAARTRHLHAHFGTNSATVALLAHALGGPPWSFTVHGPEEFDKAPLIALAEKARRAAFVAAVSSYGRSQLYRLLAPADWPKVKVVPCGLAPESFAAPATPPPFPAARRLVCVGRLSEQKGQLLLVEAARRLSDRGAAFELVLAGDGELRRPIEAALAAASLTDRVRITGWIAGDAVRAELGAARALVLPSFAEGLPVVIMEAMALARPVISTYVAGIPELVLPGTHGWLVPAGDPEALADAMQACLDAPVEALARMGAAARERVAERHDVDAAAERLAGLFGGAACQNAG
jgi:glycosyltransferase involved in cell wall biosynthesis